MPGAWERFWSEINRPSAQDGWYGWATNQCGHVLLGAGLAVGLMVLGAGGWYAWLFCFGAYALAKEANDRQRGGSRLDGWTDVLFFALGGLHMVLWWWPMAAMLCLGVGVFLRLRNE